MAPANRIVTALVLIVAYFALPMIFGHISAA